MHCRKEKYDQNLLSVHSYDRDQTGQIHLPFLNHKGTSKPKGYSYPIIRQILYCLQHYLSYIQGMGLS